MKVCCTVNGFRSSATPYFINSWLDLTSNTSITTLLTESSNTFMFPKDKVVENPVILHLPISSKFRTFDNLQHLLIHV